MLGDTSTESVELAMDLVDMRTELNVDGARWAEPHEMMTNSSPTYLASDPARAAE